MFLSVCYKNEVFWEEDLCLLYLFYFGVFFMYYKRLIDVFDNVIKFIKFVKEEFLKIYGYTLIWNKKWIRLWRIELLDVWLDECF